MELTLLHQRLRSRLAEVEVQIGAACDRARRPRDEVQLIAVTKTVSVRVAEVLHDLGISDMGESRPQELWRKAAALPAAVRWHQIGSLQTNKIDKTLPVAALIHSADRIRLLDALEREAGKQQRTADVLLQVNASGEDQKQGFDPDDLPSVLDHLHNLNHIRVRGLMTMAAFDVEPEHCRPAFALLRQLRDRYRNRVQLPHTLDELSMGMSNDFPVAIEEGATLIRLGSILFETIEEEEA